MKHLLRFVSAVAMAGLMCSCLEMKVQFLVKKDGSGKILMQNLMSPAAMTAGMGMMGGGNQGKEAPDPEAIKAEMKKDMMDEAKLKEEAKNFGEGVKFEKAEFIEREDGFFGVKAIYSFEDLNKIKIAKEKDGKKQGKKGMDIPPLSFAFKKGAEPEITVVMQTEKAEEGEAKDKPKLSAAQVDQQLGMMGMFAGMKVEVSLRVDGKITKTNGKHVSKKRDKMALMYMNLNEMMADRANLKKAMMEGGEDPAAMAKFKVKGLKAQEPGKEISIKFQ